MEQNMEYPFGFGFELMKHPEAMSRLDSMNEEEKRETVRRLSEIGNREELRKFLTALGRETGFPQSERAFRQKNRI